MPLQVPSARLVFLLTLWAGVNAFSAALAYQSLSLRVDPVIHNEQDLERGERLARIDSLETNWGELSEEEREQRRTEIVRLYSGSDLVKHRVWAAEMGEENHPGASLRRLLGAARARELGLDPWAAQRLCRIAGEAFPDSAIAYRELGRILMDLSARTLDVEGFREARLAFVAAVRCPDAAAEDWRGLAGALLVEGRHSEMGRCVAPLLEQPDPTIGDLLLAAVGRMGQGLGEESTLLFEAAVRRMDESTQRLFLATELGPAEDPNYGDWVNSLLRERGASQSTRLLWVRLVETEILFGQVTEELYGWQTAPGSLYVRYGCPDDFFSDAPCITNSCADVDEVVYALQLPNLRQRVADELNLRSRGEWLWVWVYDLGDFRLPFFFTRPNVHYDWMATPLSKDRARLVAQQLPIVLDPLEDRHEIQFVVQHAAFRTPDDLIRAEAVFAISRDDPSAALEDSFRTTFAILDSEGQIIETRSRILDESHRRSAFLAPLGLDQADDRAVVGQLALELAPEVYTLRVEVEDLITGAYRARDRRFELKPNDRIFGMSDLQLCDLFGELGEDNVVPEEFIKYAHVVVPHPEGRARPGQEALFIYFEVYGAVPDEAGQVHLDTIYEVWRRSDFHPSDAGLPRGDRSPRRPLIRADFPDERIGRTASGVVVKGTRFDLEELGPGSFIIAVKVSDRLGRDESRRFLRLDI